MPGPIKAAAVSKEEFEREYSQRKGITIEWLRKHNMVPCRCVCDNNDCKGWAYVGLFALDMLDGVSVSQH